MSLLEGPGVDRVAVAHQLKQAWFAELLGLPLVQALQPRHDHRVVEYPAKTLLVGDIALHVVCERTAVQEQLGRFAPAVELLCTFPGVGRRAAEVIIAETGGDMTAFPTAKHLASWAGMGPGVTGHTSRLVAEVPLLRPGELAAPSSPRPEAN